MSEEGNARVVFLRTGKQTTYESQTMVHKTDKKRLRSQYDGGEQRSKEVDGPG
jgi:hypothetical protein